MTLPKREKTKSLKAENLPVKKAVQKARKVVEIQTAAKETGSVEATSVR